MLLLPLLLLLLSNLLLLDNYVLLYCIVEEVAPLQFLMDRSSYFTHTPPPLIPLRI